MSNFAPLHYRKLRIAEHGAFGQLPFLARGTAAMILKFCDDRGVFALRGKAPVDAVTRKCGAEPSERKAIARHIEELIDVGYLRYGNDSLIVNEQEEDWEKISSNLIGRAAGHRPEGRHASSRRSSSTSRTSSASLGSDSSARNYSAHPVALDKIRSIRSDQEDKEEQKREEVVQGEQAPYAPKTDPTPTLRRLKLDEAIGTGSESWSFEGEVTANQSERPKDLGPNTPPQERPVPSPQRARQAPLVTVVEAKPVQGQNPPSRGTAKPKAKGRRSDDDEGELLPVDWSVKENHYAYAREKLGAQKKHVDYWADDMRDTAMSRGWRSKDWDAKFRTFMRKAMEFSRGMLPNVPDPVAVEPKRPMPPCPPPEPHIVEAAKRWGERIANGEKIDFKAMMKNVGMRLPELPPDPPELAQWRKEDGLL